MYIWLLTEYFRGGGGGPQRQLQRHLGGSRPAADPLLPLRQDILPGQDRGLQWRDELENSIDINVQVHQKSCKGISRAPKTAEAGAGRPELIKISPEKLKKGKNPFVPEPKLARDIPIQYFISK